MTANSLIPHIKAIRVSSTLDNNVKEYSKMHIIDGTEETCWNSDKGHGQFIHVTFEGPVRLQSLSITFQGGFCGHECRILAKGSVSVPFFPSDSSLNQHFDMSASKFNEIEVDQIRIMFDKSTDMFGRIVVYKLDLFGVCSM